MPTPPVLKRDWQKDHVYLVQFPRTSTIPSPSPFALKLETWLRFANVPYTNISNNFTKKSEKGQIPFIELNGRQFADSGFIIDNLITAFHKEDLDGGLTQSEKAQVTAFTALVEDSIHW